MSFIDGPIEIVVPAHNEADSIGFTLREFHEKAAAQGFEVRFLVTEDGSSDGTPDVVGALAKELPVTLLTTPERKGYSRAVIDGLQSTTSQVVGFIDGDGQYDPEDLGRLVAALEESDLAVGCRSPRADAAVRRLMSCAFRCVYRRMFPVRLKDPSSSYVLIRRSALQRVLEGQLGILSQGFWWEFNARASAAGLVVREVPVAHRIRSAGKTQVYRPARIPRIAFEHLLGLWRLRVETTKHER